MIRLKHFLLSLFLISLSTQSEGQVSENEIKAIYFVKIVNNFEWPTISEPLKIGVFSSDKKFYFTLKEYSKGKKTNGRELKVSHISSFDKTKGYDVIYFGNDKESIILNSKIKEKNVLVVTNDLKDISNSMVNFHLTYDNKLRFKVNKELLTQSGFEPTNLLLILGGSDNDILFLFEQKDSTLINERNKSIKLQNEISQKTEEIENLKDESVQIKKDLTLQEQELELKNQDVIKMNSTLEKQKSELNFIANRVKNADVNLKEKERKIHEQDLNSKQQEQQFQIQNRSIIEQEKKIEAQKEILKEQTSLINLKERDLKNAFVFAIILLVISVFALISYVGKRKSNKDLADKNNKIAEALSQLKKTQAKLVQSEKMASLGMVTAGMAHEINNPMTFIYTGITILKAEMKSYTSIIEGIIAISNKDLSSSQHTKEIEELLSQNGYEDSKESIIQTIDDILMGASRVTEIIKSLQNFSRLNENDVKTIDLKDNIKSTLVILGSHARKKNITINTDFDKQLSLIECFPASINQVIVNLISNAIDAVAPNVGEINISTKISNEICHINIIDNGKGIPEEYLGKIFDPFFTTKEVGKGTGLGLSITYNIIKKHNGNIKVTSEENKGTSFQIELPLNYDPS